MQAPGLHYLLFAHSASRTCQLREWRFVLQPSGAGERFAASDVEPNADAMRLDLLAVVRGLEALDGPARVTLLAANRFVRRGIRRDLAQWREHDWRWERFGKLVPIRDLDLWQRVDRALAIHEVECFAWNADEQDACTGRLSDQSALLGDRHGDGHFGASPRRLNRAYPLRRHDVATNRGLAGWGQEMLNSLTGLGRTALSRTA
jgi:ribonuclease HI